MSKIVNLKSIASDLGLSVATVSRILNGKAQNHRISESTATTVLEHARKMGYTPNLIAKSLRTSRTFTLGFIIPDISNVFFSTLAKKIQLFAYRNKYNVLLADADESIKKEKELLKQLVNRNVDGIIAVPIGSKLEHFSSVYHQKIPLIFVDRYDTKLPIPYFATNNQLGATQAVEHLIKNGHQNIAIIKGNEMLAPVQERLHGYICTLKKYSIPIQDKYIVGEDFSFENGYEKALQLLKLNPRPTSIFAMSNQIGLGSLQAVKSLKLNIPNDVSLVVFDDQTYMSFVNPPITTIRQDLDQISDHVIKAIEGLIANPDQKVISQLIDPVLTQRASVKKIH